MRVYVPATWPMLRKLVRTGRLEPIGGTAFALTPALREAYAAGDDEELEYAAMTEAARASLRLLAVELGLGEEATPARRVVVAADVDAVTLRPDLDDAVVRVAGAVPMSAVAADAAPLLRARALLAVGRARRVGGSPSAAREPLREAMELASACAAKGLVDEALDELAATVG